MLRQIITSSEPQVVIRLPKNMVGKTLEVLAFEIESTAKTTDKELRVKRIEEITKNSLVDLTNFRFNRDEANNYNE